MTCIVLGHRCHLKTFRRVLNCCQIITVESGIERCKSGSVCSSCVVFNLVLELPLSSLRELSGQGEKHNYRKQFRTTW